MALPFPDIDPIAFSIGPVAIRWYGIAYVLGILGAWVYCQRLAERYVPEIKRLDLDDFVIWALAGIVLGGRLGYVLIYQPEYYFAEPSRILMTWQGGMSFHGGVVGFVVSGMIYCWKRKIPMLPFGDLVASAAPIGIFLGRLANFVNVEMYGHPTTVSWGVVFPGAGDMPRHPSQIYEALGEGALLFLLLFMAWQIPKIRMRPGFIMGGFLAGYAITRSFCEIYRVPDGVHDLGLLTLTTGQLLSIPLFMVGVWFIGHARLKNAS